MNWYKRYVFAGLPAYTQNEVLYKLKLFGVEYLKEGKGDHAVFQNKHNGMISAIPMGPGSRLINPVTMKRKCVEDFGIPWPIWAKLPKKPRPKDMEKIQDLLPWNKEDPTKHNIELGEPDGHDYKNEPWYMQQEQEKEKARLEDEEETRLLEQMIREDELAGMKPVLGSDKMNWYKKANKWKDSIPGGRADGKRPSDYNKRSVEKGKGIELEHTNDPNAAKEIAIDHLEELPKYYDENKGLPAMEKELEKEDETKPARSGRYPGQQQGDEQRPGSQVMTDQLNDNELVEGEYVDVLKRMANEKDWDSFNNYLQKLRNEGHSQARVNSMMTRAMYGVKL